MQEPTVIERRSAALAADDTLGPSAQVRTTNLRPIAGGKQMKDVTEAQRVVQEAADREAEADHKESAIRNPEPAEALPETAPWQSSATVERTPARLDEEHTPVRAPQLANLPVIEQAYCIHCGCAQYQSDGGAVCEQGHGGSDAVDWETAARMHHQPGVTVEEAADRMLTLVEDVAAFWAEEDARELESGPVTQPEEPPDSGDGAGSQPYGAPAALPGQPLDPGLLQAMAEAHQPLPGLQGAYDDGAAISLSVPLVLTAEAVESLVRQLGELQAHVRAQHQLNEELMGELQLAKADRAELARALGKLAVAGGPLEYETIRRVVAVDLAG